MNTIPSLPDMAAWAARTSLEALPLVLAVLLLVRVRFCQPRWRMWIAALFFIRLALPAVPEAAWHSWGVTAAASAQPFEAIQDDAAPVVASFGWHRALPWLWAAGVVVTLGWLVASHLVTRRWILRKQQPALRWFDALAEWARVRQGVSQRVPVVVVRGLSTMAIFGWLRPRLIIPADLADRYTGEQIRGMLLHEFAHVRRRDVLWTWLALLACALHWFNPLAWLAFRRFCVDRELICDAAALTAFGDSGRHSYGDALLRSLEVTPLAPAPSLAPFFRIHPEIKQRILMITNPTNPTVWSRLTAVLLVTTLVLVTFTAARAQADGEKPKREGERSRSSEREGDGSRSSEAKKEAAPKESALDKFKRENAERKALRDGEGKREGALDGEQPREGARDGEGRKAGPRDGEAKKEGPRDGEGRKEGARDGEKPREGARDGEARKAGPRDGEAKKEGPRDGEGRKEGARDGEKPREGARDGEGRKAGPRDGEGKKEGARDGDKPREGEKRE